MLLSLIIMSLDSSYAKKTGLGPKPWQFPYDPDHIIQLQLILDSFD